MIVLLFSIGCTKDHNCSEEQLATCISQNLTFKQTDPEYVEYKKHQTLWDCWDIEHYSYTVRITSYGCYDSEADIVVKNDTYSAKAIREGPMSCTLIFEEYTDQYSPDYVLDLIRDALDTDIGLDGYLDDGLLYRADMVDIKYDSVYGFPSMMYIDYRIGLADEEQGFEFSNFEILD